MYIRLSVRDRRREMRKVKKEEASYTIKYERPKVIKVLQGIKRKKNTQANPERQACVLKRVRCINFFQG